jgi:hypothetical protein
VYHYPQPTYCREFRIHEYEDGKVNQKKGAQVAGLREIKGRKVIYYMTHIQYFGKKKLKYTLFDSQVMFCTIIFSSSALYSFISP